MCDIYAYCTRSIRPKIHIQQLKNIFVVIKQGNKFNKKNKISVKSYGRRRDELCIVYESLPIIKFYIIRGVVQVTKLQRA